MSSALQKLQEYKYEKARLKRTDSNQGSSTSSSSTSVQSPSSTPRSQSTSSQLQSQKRSEPTTLVLGTSDIEPDNLDDDIIDDDDDDVLSDSTVDSDLRSGVKNMLKSQQTKSKLSTGSPLLDRAGNSRDSHRASTGTAAQVGARTKSSDGKTNFSSLVGSFRYSGSDAMPEVFPVNGGASSSSRTSPPSRPNKRTILISDEEEDDNQPNSGTNSGVSSVSVSRSNTASPSIAGTSLSDVPKRRRLVKKRYILDSESDDDSESKTTRAPASSSRRSSPGDDSDSLDMDVTSDSSDAMMARLMDAFPSASATSIREAIRRSKGEYSAAVTLLAQQLDDLFSTKPQEGKPAMASAYSSSTPSDPRRLKRITPHSPTSASKSSSGATTTTATSPSKEPPTVYTIASESEQEAVFDEDDDMDSDASGSDSPEDYRNQEKKEQRALQFFNSAPATELSELTGCRKDQAEKIVSLRPFDNFDSLCVTLRKTKGVGEKVVYNYLTTTDAIRAVDMMLHTVAKVRRSLVDTLNIWCGGDAQNRLLEATGSVKQMLNESRRDLGGANMKGDDQDDDNDSTTTDEPGIEMTELDMTKLQQSEAGQRALREYIKQQPSNMAPTFRLKDYQLLGLNWLALLWRKKLSGILADEMGLGKTAQVIAFLAHLVEKGEDGPFLVIVPSSTLANWLREFEKFCPELVVRAYYGSQAEREELRNELVEDTSYNVIVTTYNIATGNSDERKFLNKRRFKAIILDEGHMVKNCTSARYKSLMSIKAPFRLLLTGTPLQNNLEELLSLLIFIMPALFQEHEEVLRTMFKVKVDTSNEKSTLLSKERITRARQMIAPFVLRRKKIHVLKDLPAKIHTVVECDLVPAQRALYDRLMETSALQAAFKESEAAEAAAAEAATKTGVNGKKPTTAAAAKAAAATRKAANEQFANLLMQLRKAADHPMLFRERYKDSQLKTMAKTITREIEFCDSNIDYIEEDMSVMTDFELDRLCKQYKSVNKFALKGDVWMEAGKVKVLQELLPKKIKEENSKILIFSQFTMVLDILEAVLKTMKIEYLRMDGQTKVEERQPLIDAFNDTDKYPVFLLSTKAGGFGINLTAANIVIMYDLDFNPHNDKQAEDRAHRVGQTREVQVIKLVAKNTIEEQILELANLKLKLDQHVSQDDASASETKSTRSRGASGGADGGSGSGGDASTPSAGILNLLRQNWKATMTQQSTAAASSSSSTAAQDSESKDATMNTTSTTSSNRRSSIDSLASSSSSLSSPPATSP
ncbi:hypothetical protein BGW41_007627 [Actinomortierella wolfii]|nr:hypothetical protein BGW41_007627 [Actinomortierella wolfii]